jgi:hypothetical protein
VQGLQGLLKWSGDKGGRGYGNNVQRALRTEKSQKKRRAKALDFKYTDTVLNANHPQAVEQGPHLGTKGHGPRIHISQEHHIHFYGSDGVDNLEQCIE